MKSLPLLFKSLCFYEVFDFSFIDDFASQIQSWIIDVFFTTRELHEGAVLINLKKRFERDLIYVRVLIIELFTINYDFF